MKPYQVILTPEAQSDFLESKLWERQFKSAVGARAPIRINLLPAGGTLCRFETHAAVWTKSKTLSQREIAMGAFLSAGGRHDVGL